MAERDPHVLAIDAGGTMTDTFIVDGAGSFVVGKAQTTPEDESVGFMESARDALEQWDSSPEDAFPKIASGIYSGTAMLNRLLSRTGRNIGAIVTAGNEDYLRIERGIQTYLGFSYSDRLHIATHHHNEPIVPRESDEGGAGADRRDGDRGAAAARAGRPRRRGRAPRRRGRGDLHLPAVRLPQRRARDPRRRRSSRRSRPSAGWTARCRLSRLRALSAAPRPAAAELDPDRGLRGRALAGDDAEGPRPDEGGRRRRSSCG